jgi:phosphoribosylamine--glycine ligase
MRFLGIGDSCDLGALYLQLIAAGHDVRVCTAEPLCHGTLAGLVSRSDDWRADLEWIRVVGTEGFLLFESVTRACGALQDALRRDGFQVIGGSAFGDRLENDRAFGQALLAEHGLATAPTFGFTRVTDGLDFIDRTPGRYVLKFDDGAFGSSENYVGEDAAGRDVRAILVARRERIERTGSSFLLAAYIDGVEMGTGAYFDGERFLEPACLDWEHKRFFPGDLGELTGEMGTIVTYGRSSTFFARTLKRLEPAFRAHGHCGYVNLNTIVNAQGIWPLEFTCRFGYPGFAILSVLQETGWSDLFRAMVRRGGGFAARDGFAAGIVLTVPPFPYTRKQVEEKIGLPVVIAGERDRHFHLGEVSCADGLLTTSGMYGWTMVVTGVDETVAGAREQALARAARVSTPNLRYRRDIGAKLDDALFAKLASWGCLDR